MLGWIFRKKHKEQGTVTASAVAVPAPAVEAAPVPAIDWAAELARARGADEALLALARTAGAPLPVKTAAVEALGGEPALRLAEREFRSHDRRVHQVAKKRLQAIAAQRLARESAAGLVDGARSLARTAEVPANRVVELERAWQAIDAGAVEPAQREEFQSLMADLAARLRRHADLERQHARWQAEAAAALRQLQTVAAEAAAGTADRTQLAAATGAARAVEAAWPAGDEGVPASDRARAELQRAIGVAQALDGHLDVFDRLLAAPAESPPPASTDSADGPAEAPPASADSAEAPGGDDAQAAADAAASAVRADAAAAAPAATVEDLQRQWQALPALSDANLASVLAARHAGWQQARDAARQPPRREPVRERPPARKDDRSPALADLLTQAEAALDGGALSDVQRHLGEVDRLLHGAEAPPALRSRVVATRARLAQLRSWQNWAGGRAREELLQQAEALAAATAGGGENDGGKKPGVTAGLAEDVARLSIRQRSEVIDALRKRWKELDAVAGPGAHASWQRFDAALTTAGAPVSAHLAAQRAAREANLVARQQLLDALEAAGAAVPDAPSADAVDGAAAAPAGAASPAAEGAGRAARGLATALDRFHAEWRKLGPLEHTVPRAARDALVARMQAAVRAVEAPLHAAREQARSRRQALVARAHALAGEASARGRELGLAVRALQSEWQQHAKALPLARADEQALWGEFKAAIEAAFAAREAAYVARDAEFESHAAERSALIERLQLRPDDAAPAVRRRLAEVESAWQRCGPAPRARAAALEAEFRAAREALLQWLEGSAQRQWQATCDALDAKLALCEAGEQEGAAADAAGLAAAWQKLPDLPRPLEDALRRRAGLVPSPGAVAAPDVDDLLLSIEIAWHLPTPPAFEAQRRERKLQALKGSLERRSSPAPQTVAPAAAIAALLECERLGAGQRDRLAAALAAWRRKGPQQPAS